MCLSEPIWICLILYGIEIRTSHWVIWRKYTNAEKEKDFSKTAMKKRKNMLTKVPCWDVR